MKKQVIATLIFAVASGTLLTIAYVKPYSRTLSLTTLILQFSGSRGTLPLEAYLTDLIDLFLKMFPGMIFECWFGVQFYRHFCTASIYVFSRQSHRVQWYLQEVTVIGGAAIGYLLFQTGTALGISLIEYQVTKEHVGILFLHVVSQFLWIFAMTVLVNLVSIRLGSNGAFGLVIGGQTVLIALLAVGKKAPLLIQCNPIARLILQWQRGISRLTGDLDIPEYVHLFFGTSLLYLFLICAVVIVAGCLIVNFCDLLILDRETD